MTAPADAVTSALSAVTGWEVPHAGAIVLDRTGERARAGTTDLVLPIASLSKPLTAVAVLLVAAEGLVDLDAPAGPTAEQGATLRHLLAHAAGLGAEEGERTLAPATRRIYSNWGYEVAASIVADRFGHPFAEVLRERVTGPLGMHATRLEGSPAHGVRSTVADLARFAAEILSPTLLDPVSHALLTRPAFDGLDGVLPGYGRQRPNGWTLGLEVRGTKDPHWSGGRLSATAVGHFGRTGSLIWADHEHGLALASLSGRDFGAWATAAWPTLNDAVVAALTD
jgi:CubicO group peptidase (beta-lactamase class C family)